MRTIYLDSAARKRSIGGAITSLITPFAMMPSTATR